MKTILIIEDTENQLGNLNIQCMRIKTQEETANHTGDYDTPASQTMLLLESTLLNHVNAARAKLGRPPIPKPTPGPKPKAQGQKKCWH